MNLPKVLDALHSAVDTGLIRLIPLRVGSRSGKQIGARAILDVLEELGRGTLVLLGGVEGIDGCIEGGGWEEGS